MVPVAIGTLGLEASCPRFHRTESENLSPRTPLLEHPAQAFLHDVLARRVIPDGHFTGLPQDRVGTIDCRFHSAVNIMVLFQRKAG